MTQSFQSLCHPFITKIDPTQIDSRSKQHHFHASQRARDAQSRSGLLPLCHTSDIGARDRPPNFRVPGMTECEASPAPAMEGTPRHL